MSPRVLPLRANRLDPYIQSWNLIIIMTNTLNSITRSRYPIPNINFYYKVCEQILLIKDQFDFDIASITLMIWLSWHLFWPLDCLSLNIYHLVLKNTVATFQHFMDRYLQMLTLYSWRTFSDDKNFHKIDSDVFKILSEKVSSKCIFSFSNLDFLSYNVSADELLLIKVIYIYFYRKLLSKTIYICSYSIASVWADQTFNQIFLKINC